MDRKEYQKNYQKNYRITHRQIKKEYQAEYMKKYRHINKLSILKSCMKQKKKGCNISDEDIQTLLKGICVYCGTSEYIGIDRIDSTKGYIKGNCQSCCRYCNVMKLDKTEIDFLNHIDKIHKHRF